MPKADLSRDNGSLPVFFHLSPTDNALPTTPIPVELLMPRTTLLLAVRGVVLTAFKGHLLNGGAEIHDVWFTFWGCGAKAGYAGGRPLPDEVDESPLLWQYPVGTLADGLFMESAHHASLLSSSSSQGVGAVLAHAIEKVSAIARTSEDGLLGEALPVTRHALEMQTLHEQIAAQDNLPLHLKVHIHGRSQQEASKMPTNVVPVHSHRDEQMLVSQLMKQANTVLYGKIGPYLQLPPDQTTTLRCTPLIALTNAYEPLPTLMTASLRNPGRTGAGDTAVVVEEHPLCHDPCADDKTNLSTAVSSCVFTNHAVALEGARRTRRHVEDGAGGAKALIAFPVVLHFGSGSAVISRVTRTPSMNTGTVNDSPTLLESLHQALAFRYLHEGGAGERLHNLTNHRHRKDNALCEAFTQRGGPSSSGPPPHGGLAVLNSWTAQLAEAAIPSLSDNPTDAQRLRAKFIALIIRSTEAGLAATPTVEAKDASAQIGKLLAEGAAIFEAARSVKRPSPPPQATTEKPPKEAAAEVNHDAVTATEDTGIDNGEGRRQEDPEQEGGGEEEHPEEEEEAPINDVYEGLPLPTSVAFRSEAGLRSLVRCAVLAEMLTLRYYCSALGSPETALSVTTAKVVAAHVGSANVDAALFPKVVIGGYEPHPNTPIGWLYAHHSCSDMRVHINIGSSFSAALF